MFSIAFDDSEMFPYGLSVLLSVRRVKDVRVVFGSGKAVVASFEDSNFSSFNDRSCGSVHDSKAVGDYEENVLRCVGLFGIVEVSIFRFDAEGAVGCGR